jgi:pilus assembly protein CpaC
MSYAATFDADARRQSPGPSGSGRLVWISWISVALLLSLAHANAAPGGSGPDLTLPTIPALPARAGQASLPAPAVAASPVSSMAASPAAPIAASPAADIAQRAVAEEPLKPILASSDLVLPTVRPMPMIHTASVPATGPSAMSQASTDTAPADPAPVAPQAGPQSLPPAADQAQLPAAAPAALPPLPSVNPVAPPRQKAGIVASTALTLESGTGKVIALNGAAANVFVADPKVAEVRPASATSLFVFGINPGRTTVAALDNDGHTLAQYDLMVEPQAYSATQAQDMIARLVPNSHIKVQAQARGLLLTGSVNNPIDAAQAVSIAKGFASDGANIDNEVSITSPMQVMLNVRIAQMSRTVVRNLGVNWNAIGSVGQIGTLPALAFNVNNSSVACVAGATGAILTAKQPICPGTNANALIDALAQDNLAHVLAEPNLTVKSGQPASFQVGGEFPIPVSQQNGAISVSYKDYGVILSFLPTVLSDGRIDIHVKPEVSQLDKTNGVDITTGTSTLLIPAISVSRAESSVELGSGESFAIAGLLQQNTTDNAQSVPGLGDTPLLGALFRDTAFQKQDMELVIIVTPYVVRPVSNPGQLHLPTDNYRTPSEMDRLLLMKQVASNTAPVPVKIPGAAGFIVQ